MVNDSMIPSAMQEFKVTVSEWLLNSTSAAYLLNDRDYDSHTPLLIEVHANQYSGSRMRAMNRNPEIVKEAADRRKQRQKANKARGSTDPQAAPMDKSSPHRHRLVQQLLLLDQDVLQNPHNLPVDAQKERHPTMASRRASPKAKARGRTD